MGFDPGSILRGSRYILMGDRPVLQLPEQLSKLIFKARAVNSRKFWRELSEVRLKKDFNQRVYNTCSSRLDNLVRI